MRDHLTAKFYQNHKTTERETRSQSKDFIHYWTDSKRESILHASYKKTSHKNMDSKAFLHDLENEVPSSIKKESTSSDGSPRMRKFRARTRSTASTKDSTSSHVLKSVNPNTENFIHFKASTEKLEYEVSRSIKRELISSESCANGSPSFEIDRKSSNQDSSNLHAVNLTNHSLPNLTPSSENLNEVFSLMKEEPTSPESVIRRNSRVKSEGQAITPTKTKRRRKNSKESPPTTPYALNRPQRMRIPPLAYWRGEHRSFRTLSSGEIVFLSLHIPDYSEEPEKKRRRL